MTVHELAQLGADMRRAQREYSRTGSSSKLQESKILERRFDQAVKDCLEQSTLAFGEGT